MTTWKPRRKFITETGAALPIAGPSGDCCPRASFRTARLPWESGFHNFQRNDFRLTGAS